MQSCLASSATTHPREGEEEIPPGRPENQPLLKTPSEPTEQLFLQQLLSSPQLPSKYPQTVFASQQSLQVYAVPSQEGAALEVS